MITINVAAFDDEECDKLMEAARACRDDYHNMTHDGEWRHIKSMAVKLINLDLDDDANLRETLCNMLGKDLVRSDKCNRVLCRITHYSDLISNLWDYKTAKLQNTECSF